MAKAAHDQEKDVSLIVREYYNSGGMSINPSTIRKWARKNGYGVIKETDIMAVLASMQRFTINTWQQQTKGGGTIDLHQFKATYSLDIDLKRAIAEFVKRDVTPIKLRGKRPRRVDNVAVLSVPDIHVGKLAWEPEVGEAYDTKRAVAAYTAAVEHLGGRIAREKPSRILYVVGNDLLHTDNVDNTTTRGTRQDTDTRWQYAFRRAKEMVVSSIVALAKIAPVDVVVLPGNHDRMMAWAIGEVLVAYFRKSNLVTVDNEPRYRKYRRYGRLLFGITHGDMVKLQALPTLMATEAQSEWGKTSWHEWLLGHIHRKKEFLTPSVDENMGVRLSFLPSLTASDKWHYDMGFVQANRSAEAHFYDAREGCKTASEYYFIR